MSAPDLDIRSLKARDIAGLNNEAFQLALQEVLKIGKADRAENQLLYYQPVSDRAELIHKTRAKVIFASGGNGSSKTETCLVELAACATGVFPECLNTWFIGKFRGPIQCRVIVESLTTTLHPIILPKLQWFKWTGVDMPGGERGHWGWIPKHCLIDGSWEKSWSSYQRVLTVKCFDPKTGEHVGNSTIQFMSHDQDPSDFASGDFHIVMCDEPPNEAIWRENEARTMRVNGRMFLAMTWPDDPKMPVDWIHDRIFDKAKPGTEIECFELHTTDNKNLDQDAIKSQMSRWTETERQVRIYGKPIRFSNLIHPDFTKVVRFWYFGCNDMVFPLYDDSIGGHRCQDCESLEVAPYNHVKDFDIQPFWPIINVLDPHPRKPHMLLWAAVDPCDDIWIVADLEVPDSPIEVRTQVEKLEETYRFAIARRLMDPNMGATVASIDREKTWQDEFANAGLSFELADDSDVGRARINKMLRPDRARFGPRLHIHPRCEQTIFQMPRYTWDDHKRSMEKDQKQVPRAKFDDYPTMMKYLMNSDPTFNALRGFGQIIHQTGRSRHEHKRRSY